MPVEPSTTRKSSEPSGNRRLTPDRLDMGIRIALGSVFLVVAVRCDPVQQPVLFSMIGLISVYCWISAFIHQRALSSRSQRGSAGLQMRIVPAIDIDAPIVPVADRTMECELLLLEVMNMTPCRVVVVGTVNDGGDVLVGGTFRSLRAPEAPHTAQPIAEVSLRVLSVRYFGKHLDFLNPGCSGEFLLEGDTSPLRDYGMFPRVYKGNYLYLCSRT